MQAKKGGTTDTKKRTVFSVSWSLKFAGGVNTDDKLRFSDTGGTKTDQCGFNWPPEDGATRITAKMEATLSFSPTGITWSKRGVTFKFSDAGGGTKFDCRLHRKRIWTIVDQRNADTIRKVTQNDADWVYDGDSDTADAQYPTDAKPDRAFRIDEPGFGPGSSKQHGVRLDLREIAEWHNGTAWIVFSKASEGEWYMNATLILPDGRKGGSNNAGTGAAENVPNTQPIAIVVPAQTVDSEAIVTLDGSGSSDADNDTLTYQWTQTGGPIVTLSDGTVPKPTFTAPKGPATLLFELKVTDITKVLYHHNPGNAESTAGSVTINVNAP